MATVLRALDRRVRLSVRVMGGGNADISLGLTHKDRRTGKSFHMEVWDDGTLSIVYQLLVIKATDLHPMPVGNRLEWKLEGIVMDDDLARREGSSAMYPSFELLYHSHSKMGTLNIFEHAEPRRLIEELRWKEMVEFVLANRLGGVVEEKERQTGLLKRGSVISAQWWGDRFQIETSTLQARNSASWYDTRERHLLYRVPTGETIIQPLRFCDGRIAFAIPGVNPVECTIYPEGTAPFER
jgi:hypothetical protein